MTLNTRCTQPSPLPIAGCAACMGGSSTTLRRTWHRLSAEPCFEGAALPSAAVDRRNEDHRRRLRLCAHARRQPGCRVVRPLCTPRAFARSALASPYHTLGRLWESFKLRTCIPQTRYSVRAFEYLCALCPTRAFPRAPVCTGAKARRGLDVTRWLPGERSGSAARFAGASRGRSTTMWPHRSLPAALASASLCSSNSKTRCLDALTSRRTHVTHARAHTHWLI